MSKENFSSEGFIEYLIERTIKQMQTLREINSRLRKAMSNPQSTEDVNQLGAINNGLMTAIVINIACLFDKDKRAASLFKILGKSKVNYWRKNNPFFRKVISTRNKFEAHKEIKYLEGGKFGLPTSYLIDSTNEKYLKDILAFYKQTKTR